MKVVIPNEFFQNQNFYGNLESILKWLLLELALMPINKNIHILCLNICFKVHLSVGLFNFLSWNYNSTQSVLVLKSSLTFGNRFCWFGLVNDCYVYVWIGCEKVLLIFVFIFGLGGHLSGSYAGASELSDPQFN